MPPPHLRLASINLNKRFGNAASRGKFEAWIGSIQPDLILCQEVRRSGLVGDISLPGYLTLGNTSGLNCWWKPGVTVEWTVISDCWQFLKIGDLGIHHVYLSPYHSSARTEFLLELAIATQKREGSTVILGDFNMAPCAMDGLYDGLPSAWSKKAERNAFSELMLNSRLIDYTAAIHTGRQQYSFERLVRGKPSQFRCDLLLASDHLEAQMTAGYDDTVRIGPLAFTDHSAVVAEIT
jgi:exonuclease III